MRIINVNVDRIGIVKRVSGWTEIQLHPDTNSPKYRPIRIWVTPDIASDELPDRAAVRRDSKGTILLSKETRQNDDRALLLVSAPQPGHRGHGSFDNNYTTATPLEVSCGRGAWGSGEVGVFLASPGQRVVTSDYFVVIWDGEEALRWNASEVEIQAECGDMGEEI